ncbi:MAG TPA: glycosyltransferase family 4 protein [Rudaea sp.]|nr:glycosyltransferase family 4 protein [Rudaea sp.]
MARVLALTARLPYPPREGHQLRSWHLLRALAERHDVTLLSCLREDDAPDDCAPLRDMLARLETVPIPAQRSRYALARALVRGAVGVQPFVVEKYASAVLRRRTAALADAADLIHVDMLPLMACLDDVPRALPVVLNAHNVEYLLLRQRANAEEHLPRRLFLRSQVGKLERFERAACRRADAVLACSEDDAGELRALAGEARVTVVPNGVDVRRLHPVPHPAAAHPPNGQQLVFVGQMSWFPNREGVQWFFAEILPRILAARPDARFALVGKSEGVDVPDALRAHVNLAGFVEDLAPLVQESAVYVVPLRSGSGTRLKVLEAMAFAKPIVTTRIGAQGIDLVDGEEALYADDADAFAAAVLALLADPARAARLGAAARLKAQARYDWEAIGRNALEVYAGLLADHDPLAARSRYATSPTSSWIAASALASAEACGRK